MLNLFWTFKDFFENEFKVIRKSEISDTTMGNYIIVVERLRILNGKKIRFIREEDVREEINLTKETYRWELLKILNCIFICNE